MNSERENTKSTAGGAAKERQKDGWQMPEPTFRVSGGIRIDGSLIEEAATNPSSNQNIKPSEIVGEEKPAPEIKNQPRRSENFSDSQGKKNETAAAPNREIPKIIFVAAAAVGIAVLAIIIFAAALIFYFYKNEL